MMCPRRLISVALGVLTPLTLSGCLDGMAFHADRRLRIIEPAQDDFAQAPLQLRWKAEGLGGAVVSYGVFVDRSPIAPGKSVNELRGDDRVNMYVTGKTQLVIEQIGSRTGVTKSQEDLHEITVIALDAAGARVGETNDWVRVTVVQP